MHCVSAHFLALSRNAKLFADGTERRRRDGNAVAARCSDPRDWNVAYKNIMRIMGSDSCSKQDTQCTYNVTLRRVRVTIVAIEKQ